MSQGYVVPHSDAVRTGRTQKAAVLVAHRIMRDIARAALRPGDRLPPERVMLETYDIGRGTLREALRLLEFQGVIALKPGPKGGPVLLLPDSTHLGSTLVLLMQMTDAPFRVIVEARVALEPLISRLAAERIEDGALDALGDSVRQMADGLDDQQAFLEANKRFHDVIAWSSGNAMFGYIVDSLLGIMDGTVLGIDYPAHRRHAILAAHQEIWAALRDHDAPAAQQRMQEHVDAYLHFARRRYPEVLEQIIPWELHL